MDKPYPYAAFRFRLEIGGLAVAHVTEVGGLSAETETEPYEEGGVNDFVHVLPKRTKNTNLTLKRGITDLDEMWRWHQDVVLGRFQRRNGSVVLLDAAGEERLRWNFFRAYPVKWTGPDFKSDSAVVAFESIELAHAGIRRG